jgi:hypothetical protein
MHYTAVLVFVWKQCCLCDHCLLICMLLIYRPPPAQVANRVQLSAALCVELMRCLLASKQRAAIFAVVIPLMAQWVCVAAAEILSECGF